jgi:hypothetical protein
MDGWTKMDAPSGCEPARLITRAEANTVESGTILLGKYQVERVLGEGGVGRVVRARHLQLDQWVAIKILLPHVLHDPEVVRRFLLEARAAAKLQSEHVCRVYDVGTLDDGAPYIVMESLDGTDLSGLLATEGRLAAGVAIDFLLQACDALAEAHALGIVHRDIKPSNFFLVRRPDGSPLIKVLDFGISKVLDTADARLTRAQAILGTPAYMSPEQMRSSALVGVSTDIWALGVVLYELITGARPFEGDSYSALCVAVATTAPPFGSVLPAGIAEVVARCLEKDARLRFRNLAELTAALGPYAQDQAQAQMLVARIGRVLGPAGPAGIALSPSAPTMSVPATLEMGARQVAARGRSRRWPHRLAAFAGSVLVAAGVAVVLGGGPDHDRGERGEAATPAVDAAVASVVPMDAALTDAPARATVAAVEPDAQPPEQRVDARGEEAGPGGERRDSARARTDRGRDRPGTQRQPEQRASTPPQPETEVQPGAEGGEEAAIDPQRWDQILRRRQASAPAEMPASAGPGTWQRVSTSLGARAASYHVQIAGTSSSYAYVLRGVPFDGYRDGVLLEAKGPRYLGAAGSSPQEWLERGRQAILAEANAQLAAARGLRIEWHVAEAHVAERILTLFQEHRITGIAVIHTPIR